MKRLLLMTGLLAVTGLANAQYFQHYYYPPSPENNEWLNYGMKTVTNIDTGYYACTGVFHYQPPGHSVANDRIRFLAVDANGVPIINKSYDITDSTGQVAFQAQGRHLAEYAGGYLVVGQVYNYAGNTVTGGSDVLFMKVNKAGTPVFIKGIDLGSYDDGMCIKRDGATNNYYICGYSATNDSMSKAFVMKVTSAGAITWVRKMVFGSKKETYYQKANYLALDTNGNVWSVGFSRKLLTGNKNGLIFGISSAGVLLQDHIYDDHTGDEEFNSIRRNAAGDFIAGGYHSVTIGGPKDMLVMKVSLPSGAIVWQSDYRTSNASGQCNSVANDVIERVNPNTGANEYYAAGETDCGSIGSNDALVYKLDNTGSPLGHYEYGNTMADRAAAIDIVNNNAAGDGFALFGRYQRLSAINYYASYIVKAYFNGQVNCLFRSVAPDSIGSGLVRTRLDSGYSEPLTVIDLLSRNYDHLDSTICYDTTLVNGSNARSMDVQGRRSSSMHVYPNPLAGNQVAISFDMESTATAGITIVNATGQVIMSKRVVMDENEDNIMVDLPEGLAPGLFFVKVQLPDNVFIEKLIKE